MGQNGNFLPDPPKHHTKWRSPLPWIDAPDVVEIIPVILPAIRYSKSAWLHWCQAIRVITEDSGEAGFSNLCKLTWKSVVVGHVGTGANYVVTYQLWMMTAFLPARTRTCLPSSAWQTGPRPDTGTWAPTKTLRRDLCQEAQHPAAPGNLPHRCQCHPPFCTVAGVEEPLREGKRWLAVWKNINIYLQTLRLIGLLVTSL